jgi:hypothetical protein
MTTASISRAADAALGGRPRPRRHGGPRPTAARGALAASARVRWDRVGRIALLCVLAALLFLYVSAGFHMFSKWRQSRHDGAALGQMEREHVALIRQHQALSGSAAVEASARKLGMMRANEQPYVVTGLPDN